MIMGIVSAFLEFILQWYVWMPTVGILGYLTWRNYKIVDDVVEVDSTLLVLEIPKANDKSELAAEQLFASLHGILRDRLEIEGVRTDHHRGADRARLDQILATEGQPTATDQRDVGRCVVGEHLSHRIAEQHPRVRGDRFVRAAALRGQPACRELGCDRVETLGVARYQQQQGVWRCVAGEGIEFFPDRVDAWEFHNRAVVADERLLFVEEGFSLSDPAMEEALYDTPMFREFAGLDMGEDNLPDESTILRFRHLLERHQLSLQLLATVNATLTAKGLLLKSGTVVDATLIAAPSSTKNSSGERDPEMHQTKKGNQWHFGFKAHIGVDAGTGYVHTVSATAANVHDLDETVNLVRDDDEVVYADAGYQGVQKRPEVAGDEHLSTVEFRVAERKGRLKTMAAHDRRTASRQAGVRAKVEHPFLVIKRDFGFTKTRYRGIGKNLNHLHVLFASANWLMRARAVALMG